MTQLGCPKCGATLDLAPPDTIHTVPSTIKPDNAVDVIERAVECADANKPEFRRIAHKVPIFWSKSK